MTVHCHYCTRTVYMPDHMILRQLLEYGSNSYCPPCEKTWRTL